MDTIKPDAAPTLSLSSGDVATIYRALMAYPCSGSETIQVASLLLRLRQLPPPPEVTPERAPATASRKPRKKAGAGE